MVQVNHFAIAVDGSVGHRDIIHRGSLPINIDTYKVKPDLSAPPPVKWLKFSQCVASHCQSMSFVCAVSFALPVSTLTVINLSLFVQEFSS